MWADICTTVTLDTVFWLPYRYVYSDTTFFVCCCSGRCSTINIFCECRYREGVTFLSIDLALDVVYEVLSILSTVVSVSHEETFISCIFPALRNFNFYNLFCTSIDSCPVLLNNVITLTSVSSFCCCFHQFDRLLFRNDSCKFEECRLKDCVDTCWSHASLNTDLNTIDGVEFDIVVSDECFNLSREMFLKTFHIPCTVKKECTAINKFLNHVVFVYIGRIVTCNKVCFVDQVCGFDRFLTETKVRHCNTAGLLGVIIEVSLSVHVCIVTDDLDGVLVSTYSTICSKSPELTVCSSFWCCNKRSACFQRKVCNIINDTDCEFFFCCVLVYCNDLCRCSIFGTKTVTSCEDLDIFELAVL